MRRTRFMHTLDLTLSSPEENLALDEAFLLEAEERGGPEVLRFWMSPLPFVVVGLGARVSREVHPAACAGKRIPIRRRCSGGGTVVQGPGCLNYTLVLKIAANEPLASIHGANRFIMSRHAEALSALTHEPVRVEGHTDLAIHGRKVSGNAQRRLRRHLLFHGTFLLRFPLELIANLLPSPQRQPDYRRHRPHAAFLRNLELEGEAIRAALRRAWAAGTQPPLVPADRVAALVREKYANSEWIFRGEPDITPAPHGTPPTHPSKQSRQCHI